MFSRTMFAAMMLHLILSQPASALPQEKAQPELTPHQLLQSGKPDEALAMMQRDRKWIYKADPDNHCTPLHVATQRGYLKVVQWLLDNDADVYARAYNQLTALDFAREPEIVALILKAKPELEPDRARWHSATPLQGAAENYADETEEPVKKKWLKIVELMRAAGANYDLISAIYINDLPHVRKILATDPEDAHQRRPRLPLRVAAEYGRLEICKELLKVPDVDVNDVQAGNGYPIVKEALEHPDVVRVLVKHGADITSRISRRGGGMTGIAIVHENAPLLHHAANYGATDTVTLLLDQGADPFVEIFDTFSDSKEPQTAVDVAAIMGRVDNLLAIVRHPSFRDAEKKKRQPLLNRCLVCGTIAFQDEPVDHVQLYKGLLDAGADPNAIYNNRTAIQEAAGYLSADDRASDFENELAMKKNKSLRDGIAILRQAGAKIDLFSAAALGDEKTAREILKANPKEASMIGPDGVPAIHKAVEMNHAKIVSLLLEAGCDVNLRDQSDEIGGTRATPLDRAESDGREEMMELLIKAKGRTSSELDEKTSPPLEAEIK